MAGFVDCNDRFSWYVFNSGKAMPIRKNNCEGIPVNAEGHFTTVDGIPVRKLFVSNLARQTSGQDLFALFSRFGNVIESAVVKSDIPSNKPIFGFVTFETPSEATCSLMNKHSIYMRNRRLFVSPADSWHQPLELPDGQLVLDRRRKQDEKGNPKPNEEEEVDVSSNDIEVTIPDDSCAISKLNDDCLLMIFGYIPMNMRLPLHRVCRRWQFISMAMWSSVRKLDFTVEPMSEEPLYDRMLRNYLPVCSNITNINIATDNHRLTSDALIIIAEHCPKLEEITMRDLTMKNRTLAFFAKSCPRLKVFSIDACNRTHDSEMIGLVKNAKNLERISLKYSLTPSGHWLRFLRSPLKSLSLEMYDFEPEYLIMGIKNAQESLRELKFISCDSVRGKDIQVIAATLPKLTQLTLAGGFSDFKSHSLIPIAKLKHLVRLDLDNNSFVCDQFLEELAENCKSLETFTLSGNYPGIDDRYLTNQGLSKLSHLPKLTHLTLACSHKLTDSILKSISQKVKGLKHLGVMGCTSITDEGCQSVVTNCKYLETLDVSGCTSVTNLTIIAAAESTRGTGRTLKIIAGESGIDVYIECPPSIILDPSSSVMANYPGTMYVFDPNFGMDGMDGYDHIFLDDDLDELSDEFDDEYGFDDDIHQDSSDADYDDYILFV